jgi:diphthamide synthase (EF-2-diphthine--ammonia ligase)
LPADVDPCGENGEYHSFVFDGPNFDRAIAFETGPVITRDNRHYIDLIPAVATASCEAAVSAAAIPPVQLTSK